MLSDRIGLAPSFSGQWTTDVARRPVCSGFCMPEKPDRQACRSCPRIRRLLSGVKMQAVDGIHVGDDRFAEQLSSGRLQMDPVVGPYLFVRAVDSLEGCIAASASAQRRHR